MTADSTPHAQTSPTTPYLVRDRLQRQFSLLGVGVHVGVTQLGSQGSLSRSREGGHLLT